VRMAEKQTVRDGDNGAAQGHRVMSREIDIGYVDAAGKEVRIEIQPPYFLLGTQRPSKMFWSIPRIKEVGIEQLSILGELDPVYFWGWDGLAALGREIELLGRHLHEFYFEPESKAAWLSHLTYCYHLLNDMAPKDSEPQLGIG
jgi:hypothetical protein